MADHLGSFVPIVHGEKDVCKPCWFRMDRKAGKDQHHHQDQSRDFLFHHSTSVFCASVLRVEFNPSYCFMLPCEFVSIISITAIDYKFIPALPPDGHRLLSHTAVSVYLAYVWHSGAVQQCNTKNRGVWDFTCIYVRTRKHKNIFFTCTSK